MIVISSNSHAYIGAQLQILMLQGDLNIALGKLIEAYEVYQEAKCLAEEEGESENRKAEIVIRQQSVVHARGNNEEALNSLKPLLKESGNLSLSTLALLKRTIGNTYRSAANYHLGGHFLSEAVQMAEKIKDINQAKEWKGELGRISRSVGLYKQALELQKEAYEAALARGDVARLASACGYFGFTHYSLAKPNHIEAVKYLGTRLYLCEKKLKDPEGIRWCLNNIGKVYLSMGNTQSAIPCFKRALKLAEGTGNLLSEGTAVGNLGSALREAGRYEEAVKCHKEYLSNTSKRLDPGGEAIMLYELALDHVHMGDLNKAKKFALKGVVTLQNIHASLSSQDNQTKIGNFEKNQTRMFNVLQHILTELGQNDVALFASELGRAQTLVDSMQRSSGGKSQFATDLSRLIDNNACLNSSMVSVLYDHIVDLICQLDSTLVVYSLIELPNIPGRRREQWVYIWVLSSHHDKIQFSKRLLVKDGVTEFQLDDDTLSTLRRDLGIFDEKHMTSSNKYDGNRDIKIFKTKKPKGQGSTPIKTSPSVLSEGSGTFQTESSDKSTEDTHSSDRLIMLYNLLIDPIKQFLPSESTENPSRLIFIPHSVIFSVPFAALRKGNNYLVEQFILTQVPALTVLDILLGKLKNSNHSSTEALIAGNPDMPHKMIAQLPGAEKEGRSVHKILGGKLLLKEEATKEAIQGLLPTSSVIHLATHATLADSIAEHLQLEEATNAEIEGDYSIKGAIVLSKSSPSCSGILTSSEVLNISLTCELMTLSCCRTGCGKVTGDGILGLSRAVLVAGANCLIATLWAIEDDSTSKLMQTFYSHYKDTRNASEALRAAMLSLLREDHTVAHWAAFCVSGISPGMVHSTKSNP